MQQEHHFEDAFVFERGQAITQYAYYEESLVCLFGHLMGVDIEVAGIPFFRINNARARLAILERLLKKRCGGTYNVFWNSLGKELRALDAERNNIVHWTTVTTWSDTPFTSLVPPNHWDADENTPSILHDHLVLFTKRCVFFTGILSYFLYRLQAKPFVPTTWHQVFLQPVTYPPPADHPLCRTSEVQPDRR